MQHSADVHGEGGEAGVGTVAEQDGEWQQTSELGDGAAAGGSAACLAQEQEEADEQVAQWMLMRITQLRERSSVAGSGLGHLPPHLHAL